VTSFPNSGGKRQVSTTGGAAPRWRADGKELFYVAAGGHLTAAEVAAKGDTFEVSQGVPLFATPTGGSFFAGVYYDVSADGQRFLVALAPDNVTPEPLTVVQNWTAGLKK